MSPRLTQLDKAIKALDEKINILCQARDELLTQKHAGDLAAARPPALKTVAK